MPGNVIALTSTQSGGQSQDTVQHAVLELFETKPQDGAAGARRGAALGTIDFQFNPKELSISKSASWQAEPARGSKKSGPPEFKGSDPAKLTLEMFFDATDRLDTSVVDAAEKLLSCCVPTDASRQSNKPSPPLVVLHWGQTHSVTAYITSVSVKYTLFTSAGTPIRATASVSLQEMPEEPAGQNPTSGSLSVSRTHTVVEGDSLASVAYREYGDPTMWRTIAEANAIDDPLRLSPGTALLVPDLGRA